MKIYVASAVSDRGIVYLDERVKASGWRPAFAKAAHLAKYRGRKSLKMINIKLTLAGNVPKDTSYLGLPADENTPEKPL